MIKLDWNLTWYFRYKHTHNLIFIYILFKYTLWAGNMQVIIGSVVFILIFPLISYSYDSLAHSLCVCVCVLFICKNRILKKKNRIDLKPKKFNKQTNKSKNINITYTNQIWMWTIWICLLFADVANIHTHTHSY